MAQSVSSQCIDWLGGVGYTKEFLGPFGGEGGGGKDSGVKIIIYIYRCIYIYICVYIYIYIYIFVHTLHMYTHMYICGAFCIYIYRCRYR